MLGSVVQWNDTCLLDMTARDLGTIQFAAPQGLEPSSCQAQLQHNYALNVRTSNHFQNVRKPGTGQYGCRIV